MRASARKSLHMVLVCTRVAFLISDKLDNGWSHEVDDEILQAVISDSHPTPDFPIHAQHSYKLCDKCEQAKHLICQPGFTLNLDLSEILNHVEDDSCDLCSLLWKTVGKPYGVAAGTVVFESDGSFIRVRGSKIPLISIDQDYGKHVQSITLLLILWYKITSPKGRLIMSSEI